MTAYSYTCPECGVSFSGPTQVLTFSERVQCHEASACTPSEPPVFPLAGDTVIITLTPTVVAHSGPEWITLVGGTVVLCQDVASIEKVPDPLPTTPGSVVYVAGTPVGFALTLWPNKKWGLGSGIHGVEKMRAYYGGRLTVLFDAGKATP